MSADRRATLARIRAHASGRKPRAARARTIAAEIRRQGRYRWVGIYDIDETEVSILAWSGSGAPAHPRFPRDQGLTGRAIALGATVVVDDVAADPAYLEAFDDTRAEAIFPAVDNGAVVGTIDVESAERRAFGDADRAFVEACRDAAMPLWQRP